MADEVTGKGQAGNLPSLYADQFSAFRTEMDHLFDSFLTGMPRLTSFRQSFPAVQALTPAWDIKESEKELVVKAELPGVDEKDIHLTIQDGMLNLRGEKKVERTDKHENYHYTERSYGSFRRSIRLPETVDDGKAEARFDKGVLTVILPKRPEAVKEQKKIEIKTA